MAGMVGRHEERRRLERYLASGKAELIVVYGRRRVGKTYLVSEFFGDRFAFRATGLSEGGLREQLAAFGAKLAEHGGGELGAPGSWIEAFSRLKALLSGPGAVRDPSSGRRVVFIDEMPWLDTPRSGFRAALEWFWNDWGCRQSDLALVVCGSATSWIARNLLETRGGLYDRVTRVVDLRPFTPRECREYFDDRGFSLTPQQMVECGMVFGGVPYYLDLLDRGASLAQNVDELCFGRGAQLRGEFGRLFATLFKHPGPYADVVRALAGKRAGMTRGELRTLPGMAGSQLTKVLSDLELCGFVRGYRDFTKRTRGAIYQLVDPFTLFHLRFIEPGEPASWTGFSGSPAHAAWSGLAFEAYCLNNVGLVKEGLGVSGVETSERAWRSADGSAQVDLLIDRADGVVNVCEMKYSGAPFAVDAALERRLRERAGAFARETGTRKALHVTMVTVNGLARNAHSDAVVHSAVDVGEQIMRA